jgi:hypothetical protein
MDLNQNFFFGGEFLPLGDKEKSCLQTFQGFFWEKRPKTQIFISKGKQKWNSAYLMHRFLYVANL